jgi:hypothetical protein
MRMPDKWHGIILGNDEGAEADGRREWQREVGGGGLAASEEPRDGGNARAMPYGSKGRTMQAASTVLGKAKAEALAELPAVARDSRGAAWMLIMDAAPGCRLQRRSSGSANILTAWPGRVAQAPTKSGSSARSLVLLTMLAPVVENRTRSGTS